VPIDVTCACGKVSRTREEDVGKRARCRACGDLVTIGDPPPPVRPVKANPARAVASVLGFACLILGASVYERHSAAVVAGRERDLALARVARLKDEVESLVRAFRASPAARGAERREQEDAEAAAVRSDKQAERESAAQRAAGEAAARWASRPPAMWFTSQACSRVRDDPRKFVVLLKQNDGRLSARLVEDGRVDPEVFAPEFYEFSTMPIEQFLAFSAATSGQTNETFRVLKYTELGPGDYQADVCGLSTGKLYDLKIRSYQCLNLFWLNPDRPLAR
jgi:hypothetical protein